MGSLLCLVALIASAVLLYRAIRRFTAAWRAAEIARGPAVPLQSLRIPAEGPLALFLEGPRYGTYRKRLRFGLRDPETDQPVPIQRVLMGSGVRSLRRCRVQRGRLVLPRPGTFELQVEGLQPEDVQNYEVVLMRPIAGRVVRFVLACVALGIVLFGSLVRGVLSLVL